MNVLYPLLKETDEQFVLLPTNTAEPMHFGLTMNERSLVGEPAKN